MESLARKAGVPGNSNDDTLGSILHEVWTQNPRVAQDLASIQAAGYDTSGARTGYFPFLAVDSRQATNNASATTVSLVQPLWNGGLTGAQVREAQVQKSLTLVDLNQTRLDLGLQTAQAYFNAVLAQEQGDIWAQYSARLQRLLGVIKRRSQQGLSPPVDVETALARVYQAQAGAAAARSALAVNRSQLAALLDHEPGALLWPSADSALTADEAARVGNSRLVTTHPLLQRSRFEVALAQTRVDVSRAQLWPQISVERTEVVQQSAGDFTPEGSTQLTLQYQTDSGLRGFRGAQAQQRRVDAAHGGLQFARLEVVNRVHSALAQRRSARVQFKAQAASAESSRKLVDSFLRQFKAGRKSWIEVLNAQQRANQALLQTAAIRSTFWLANAQIALQAMMWRRISPNAPPVLIEGE